MTNSQDNFHFGRRHQAEAKDALSDITNSNNIFLSFRVSSPWPLAGVFIVLACGGRLSAQETNANAVLLHQPMAPVPTFIVTNVTVGPENCLMVVDTGAEITVLDPSLRSLLRSAGGSFNALDTENRVNGLKLYEAASLSAQSLVVRDAVVGVADLDVFRHRIGQKVRGVLGMPELGNGKILVNYDAGFLEIHSGPWKLDRSKATDIGLDAKAPLPRFEARIAGYVGRFVVDSGSDGCIALEASLFASMVKDGIIEPSGVDARVQVRSRK